MDQLDSANAFAAGAVPDRTELSAAREPLQSLETWGMAKGSATFSHCRPGSMLPIVKATGQDPDLVPFNFINQAVLLVDATRPTTSQFMLEGFRLPRPAKGITLHCSEQFDDAQRFTAVLFHPPCQILKSGRVKFQVPCRPGQSESPPCVSWP